MGTYKLEEMWKEGRLQEMQAQYSELAGMSMWMLDKDESLFGERALMPDMTPEILEFLDGKIAFLDGDQNFAKLEWQNKKLLLGKRFLFLEQQIAGFFIFVRIGTDEDDTYECAKQADFWVDLVSKHLSRCMQMQDLQEKLVQYKSMEEKLMAEQKRLQQENDYDELTKVHSRTYFYKKLEEVEKQEELLPVSLVVGDVNNLKFTNDMFGHRHGDLLLYKVAEVLREEAEYMKGETGIEFIVARCGGDEFNILMPNTKRAAANYYCYRVTQHLNQANDCCLTPSVALGSAKKSEMNQSLHRLLETADAKMYAAKSEFKRKQDQFEEIMDVLFSRGYLSREAVDQKMRIVREFAGYMGWDEETVTNCVNLIRYQDVGLTIVPERIYGKGENYTDREWREIKKHPQLGMKLALIRQDLAPISNMMYMTHENYDGSGWPKGIKGTEIRPEVLAVRLVTEYVDKCEKHTEEEAQSWIQSESGTIFEPQMTEQFMRFLETQS